MTDEWTRDESATLTDCERCGNYRPCLPLPDPFIRDVYPEDDNPAAWWCWPCYEARADEI